LNAAPEGATYIFICGFVAGAKIEVVKCRSFTIQAPKKAHNISAIKTQTIGDLSIGGGSE
jgi:hypothetical protein